MKAAKDGKGANMRTERNLRALKQTTYAVTYEPFLVVNGMARADAATFRPAGYTQIVLIEAATPGDAKIKFHEGNNGRVESVHPFVRDLHDKPTTIPQKPDYLQLRDLAEAYLNNPTTAIRAKLRAAISK